MPKQPHRSKQTTNDKGAALITALIIVAIMAVVSIAILDTIRFSFRITTNLAQRDQAQLLLIGAEKLASETITTVKANSPAGTTSFPVLDEWTKQPMVFPIEGGQITGRVSDHANCFNLNALVKLEADGYVAAPEHAKTFERLLEILGITPPLSVELSNSLTDWMDRNASPGFGGAEDPRYMAMDVPYRTSETLLHDISELKAIHGFNSDVFDLIAPFVCALPDARKQPLNVNSLHVGNFPVLQAYLGDGYEPQDVENLILERPVGGYSDIRDYFLRPVFGENGMPEEQRQFFALNSAYYALNADIHYYDTELELTSLVKVSESGQVSVVSRRFGGY